MKKILKFGVDVKIWQGQNYIKLKVLDQFTVQLKEIKCQKTKLNFSIKSLHLKPKSQNDIVLFK
jgi:hypothetical protein